MEKKYLVVVYRNLRSANNYVEFTDRQRAEHWHNYMLNIADGQKDKDKDEDYYIIDVRLYTMVEVWSSM